MAGATTNFGLIKPDVGENYDVNILNGNFDDIDEAIFGRVSGTAPFGHAGRTAGFQTIGGTDVAVTITQQKLIGGLTFESASGGRFVIPIAGRYRLTAHVYATNGSGYTAEGGVYVDSVKKQTTKYWKADGTDFYQTTSVTLDLTVGQKVGLGMTSTQSTWGTTGYDGAWLEVQYVGAS